MNGSDAPARGRPARRRGRRVVLAAALIAALAAVLSRSPAAAQTACGNVAVRSPFEGDQLQGEEPILGSARIDDFNFYKVEWAAADDPERWSAVSDIREQEVLNGLLDQWDTTRVPDGRYRIKLTVVDNDFQEVCRTTIEGLEVTNAATPEPTATQLTVPTAPPNADAAAPAGPSPTPEPTATLAPIIPREGDGDAAPQDALDPAMWAAELGVDDWLRLYLRGFIVTFIAVSVALLINVLRRPQ